MHADDFRRRGQSIDDSYQLNPVIKGGRTVDDGLERTLVGSVNHHDVSIEAGAVDPAWDSGSQRSQSHIIKQTRTFAVESSSTAHIIDPRQSTEESLGL